MDAQKATSAECGSVALGYIMQIGLEIEFWVIDDQGRLCDGHELTDVHPLVEPEFVGPLIEIQTESHSDERALRRDLQETLQDVMATADRRGKQLVALGTPLTDASTPTKKARGRLQERIYGDGIRSAKNCAGTHIHFEKGTVLRQLNMLTALDPALSLVSSSPYYLGTRNVDSSRAAAYRQKCGREFERFCGLKPYAESVSEWEARVDEDFEAFKTLAGERGVSSDEIDDHFTPENTVLNPVRLRYEQPTVEWRAPDSTLPSQVVRLASDVGALVEQTETKPVEIGSAGVHFDRIGIPDFETLAALSEQAIRWGLDSERVTNYLHAMNLDPAGYQPISRELRGPGTLKENEARRIRLEYAARLRADVNTLTTRRPSSRGFSASKQRFVTGADSNV